MNTKTFCFLLLALTLTCGILSIAAAESPESPAISAYDVSYTQDGFLYKPLNEYMIYFYDYAAGQRRALCTCPECNHELPEEINPYSFDFLTDEFMNNNPSLCYAAKLACMTNINACVMYDRKLYFFPVFVNDPQPGTNTLPLYVSEEDGETRLLTDLGSLFSAAYDPYALEALSYDGYLYYEIFLYEKLPLEGEKAITPDPELPPGSIQLVKCSMTTGEASVMETFNAENNEFHFLGLYNDVLYYLIKTANNLNPVETEWDYLKDVRNKTHYSIQGINVKTGKKCNPDPRLCDRTLNCGEAFDIVKDGILYSIVLPETAENNTALFLGYDLNQQKTILEYPFEYIETDNYPYRVLTDEIMLAFNYRTGTFSLYNLKNGEIKPLTIPGACINGNSGQKDWYDLFTAYFQTNPLIFDHRFSETEVDKAYITVEELMNSNPQMHDFAEK